MQLVITRGAVLRVEDGMFPEKQSVYFLAVVRVVLRVVCDFTLWLLLFVRKLRCLQQLLPCEFVGHANVP